MKNPEHPPNNNNNNKSDNSNSYPKPNTTIFHTHPFTTALLTNPSYKQIHSLPMHTLHHDPYFRLATSSSSGVPQTLFLFRASSSYQDGPEGHLLLLVGKDVCGQPGIAHGGFLATVMDEMARLDVGYKRPVFVGGDGDGENGMREGNGDGTILVATARVKGVEGRKVFVEAAIRDGDGVVCTTAEAVFVKKKPAL
ncbi:HotDog domain-containing protein [Aspergillus egyptiacus]|nr:HotDog domain-containing protein [Aspergillus egyptiacus]